MYTLWMPWDIFLRLNEGRCDEMTSSRPRHPALAVRDFTRRIETMDQVDLESLAGWDSFTPDQKRFLAVYPWFGQKKTAAEYIGHNKQWVDRNQRRDKTFHSAVENRLHSPERIARHYGADLLGKAMLRLDEMLDEGGADKRTQLDAIKTVLRLNDTLNDTPTTQVNNGSVQNNLVIHGFME